MKTALKILIGLILVLAGLYLYLPKAWGCLGWWKELLILIKGVAGFAVILIGLVFFAIAKE